MDCSMDDTRILDYLNGLLSARERTLFEEHLAACPECRREIVELRKTAAAVAGLTAPSVPQGWASAAKERLRAKISSPAAADPLRPASTAAGAPGFARGSTSAVLARGYKPRASGEPKARPLIRRRTNVFQYAVITAGVTAGLVLLSWLVMGGTIERWLPGFSAAALGISEPRAARTASLVTWIVSLHALLFVPSIIDNIYRLVRRGGRRRHPRSSAGFFAC